MRENAFIVDDGAAMLRRVTRADGRNHRDLLGTALVPGHEDARQDPDHEAFDLIIAHMVASAGGAPDSTLQSFRSEDLNEVANPKLR